MKNKNLLLLLLMPVWLFSQMKTENFPIVNQINSGENYMIPENSVFTAVKFEKQECITPEQELQLNYEIAQNRQKILEKDADAFKKISKITLFQDPYRPKAGFTDYGYHVLQNQVDQDLTPNGHLLDYFCGQRTYDQTNFNHGGTDYILWPYPWKRMDENTMEIVAAAPGMIINKKDGFADKNCLNNGNPNWNGVIIQHSDGSIAIYMHFKKNTVTSKAVGDMVSAGEFLGIAGSSGSSTIPHLHFEVRDENNNIIDPYMGPCNAMNSSSWWQVQENYYVPRVNRISTHYIATQDSNCPDTENTYEKVNFNNGDPMIVKLFYRDIQNGDVTNIKIKRPNGTILVDYSWTQNWNAFYPSAYASWYWTVTSSWPTGVYTIEVTFGGNTYQTIFGVRTALSAEDVTAENVAIYPNPVKDILYIKNYQNPASAEIIDASGRSVLRVTHEIKRRSIDVRSLPKGNYILRLTNDKQQSTTMKFIKQ